MRIRPSIYLTADTHFWHSRLWKDWGHRKEGFEKDLIAAWNSVIRKDDVVLHLGDLSLANKEKTKECTDQLKGKKYLIRGNHDGNTDTWYRDCGFEVIPNAYQRFKQKDGLYIHILFTHEPVIPLPYLSMNESWFNIHGHLHGDSHRGIVTTDHHFDVGVDAIGFKPIPLYKALSSLCNPF